MKWNMIWSSLFGATSFLGIDMGFWVTMAAVFLIVIAMNAVFWGMKPRNPDSPETEISPGLQSDRGTDCRDFGMRNRKVRSGREY